MKSILHYVFPFLALALCLGCTPEETPAGDNGFDVRLDIPAEILVEADASSIELAVLEGKAPKQSDMMIFEGPAGQKFCKILAATTSSVKVELYDGLKAGQHKISIQRGLDVKHLGSTKISLKEAETLRLLHWNIQNGMWDGQNDGYGRFVAFVKSQDPDVCVWCEAQSIWKTDSDQKMAAKDRYLVENWGKLAARYGHEYWGIGGHRDNFPQVITSKYPITYISKITGDESDVIVTHGAGWATIEVNGKKVNIVTLHTWPQAYAYRAEDEEASIAEHGGDKYRAKEIQYICEHTIGTVENASDQLWMMMGDFNSRSRVDNAVYGYADDDTRFLVHDYVRNNTPYIDVIKAQYPDKFIPSFRTKKSRIDFVYCTQPLYDRVTHAEIIWDEYTTPVRDPQNLSNFWRPSDHLPILVDFDMR